MIRRSLAAAALMWVAPGAAHAAISFCLASATGVAFGAFSGRELTATGTIQLVCTGNANATFNPVTVSLSRGQAPNFDPRKLRAGAGALDYNLYLDAQHRTIWGDGSSRTRTVTERLDFRPGLPIDSVQLTVFGDLPAQRTPSAGHYTDTIVVTVEF